ncbi:CdaR family protein [Desulfurivibrio alkaliphilus]|uniref:YbbR family protein n=1 Tax=Desulfurivibrio alkaliphilus (strain DSM 19089 / UNIQEM U267 / AHT2) TaxID=589865 RepID=D6YZZ3_DESAT|nr:CdaR family protein [Desulfurivibrio alkaliphilus]ADH85150.1 YbbR family protein [Desulfurivibrio alkaliphilus AHT 2]
MEKLVEQIKKAATTEVADYWPKDWVLRLLALLFAVLLWHFVVGEDKIDTHVLVPVELVNLPRDMVIVNQYKQQLEVTIAGPRGLIDGLRRQNVTRTINLAGAQPGTMAIRNDPDSIPFPRGIEVLRVQPAHTTLHIDHLQEKNFPVEPKITGQPAPGYLLLQVQADPATISIRGPATLLGQTDQLPTVPVDIEGLTETTSRQVALVMDEKLTELLGETTVKVRLIIEPEEAENDENRRDTEPVPLLPEQPQP